MNKQKMDENLFQEKEIKEALSRQKKMVTFEISAPLNLINLVFIDQALLDLLAKNKIVSVDINNVYRRKNKAETSINIRVDNRDGRTAEKLYNRLLQKKIFIKKIYYY